MADWKEFCDFYSSNFGRLTESDGLKEWAQFVENEVRDMRLLREALQPIIERFAAALDNMEPTPRKPTLGQVRRAYYVQCAKRRAERDVQRFGAGTSCGLCHGGKYVFVLAPLAGDDDRKNWPEDFRIVPWEKFRGVELALCPDCVGRRAYTEEQREKIQANSLPQTIDRNSPDWPDVIDQQCRRFKVQPPSYERGDRAIITKMRGVW